MPITEHKVKIESKLAEGQAVWVGFSNATITFSTTGFERKGVDPDHSYVEIALTVDDRVLDVSINDKEEFDSVNKVLLRFTGDDEVRAAAALFSFLGEELTKSHKAL